MRKPVFWTAILVLAWTTGRGSVANAQSTAFTYQGRLQQSGTPATGPCDFEFRLFDAVDGGTEIGTAQAVNGVTVSDGLFVARVDFGSAAFSGANRWLEIGVRCPAGSGNFATLSPRQALTPAPYAISAPAVVRDQAGQTRAQLGLTSESAGFVQTFGPNGMRNVLISHFTGAPDAGFIGVYDSAGSERAAMAITSPDGIGIVRTTGPNGNFNVVLSNLSEHPNNGFVAVRDADGNTQAGMFVNANGQGEVFADVKNFIVAHPNQADSRIVYASLEGPEVAIYHRGKMRLEHGRATIALPEHFVALANPDSVTVQLTPTSIESKGLAVVAVHDDRIEVAELQHGRGSYEVYVLVHAVRRGYEGRQPIVKASDLPGASDRASSGGRADAHGNGASIRGEGFAMEGALLPDGRGVPR